MERVTTPFLDTMGQYGPNLVGALTALVVGLIAAGILAALSRRLFARTGFDERVAHMVRGDESIAAEPTFDSARWLSRFVFWFVAAIAILAFFQVLGFTPVTIPIQNALGVAIGFLPRLLAAVGLLILAWLVASFLRLVVRRALDALKLDARLGRHVGGGTAVAAIATSATGSTAAQARRPRVSNALGQATYWLTLLLFLPAILGALQLEGILGPVQGMVNEILAMLPNVITAAVIIGLAYFVGRIVAGLATSLLSAVGTDRLAERVGLLRPGMSPNYAPSRLLGIALQVVIVLVASMEALAVINFAQLSAMLGEVVALIAQVVVGLIIFGVGVMLSSLAARAIRSSNVQAAGFFANAARVAILVLAGAMGLQQMGLAEEIVNLAFGLLLGGVAIAAAIAFGVGGRAVAARELEDWVRSARARHGSEERIIVTDEAMPSPH